MKNDKEKKILEYFQKLFREDKEPEEIFKYDKKTLRMAKIIRLTSSKIFSFFVKYKALIVSPLNEPSGIFKKVFALAFWIFMIFLMLLIGFLFIIFLLPIFLIQSVKEFRFKKILLLKSFHLKRLVNPLFDFVKSIIGHMFFSYIRNMAKQYYNGRISYEKVQKRIKKKFKHAFFGDIIEIDLVNKLNFYLHSNPIVMYYCCYLLHDKLKSTDVQFELQIVWIKSAVLTGLTKDAEIFIKKSLLTNENKNQNTELLHYFAFLLIFQGRNNEAIEYLNQVIEFYCDVCNNCDMIYPLIDAYGLRGIAFRNTGMLEEGINDFSEALDLILATLDGQNYSNADVFINIWSLSRNAFNMAITYHDKGEYENALEYYKVVLDQQKGINQEPFLSAMFDITHMFRGAAVQIFKKNVIISNSKHIDHTLMESYANGNIGLILLEQKALNLAIEYLEKALNISEQNADIHGQRMWNYYLGVVCEERGELENAYEYYKKSIDFLELLRHEYKSKDFYTAFDQLERGFRNRYFWGWNSTTSSWASIERLSTMPKMPCTRDPFENSNSEDI